MQITVYQMKLEHPCKFRGYDELVKAQGGLPLIDRAIYDEVYSGEVKCTDLAQVYAVLNDAKPDGYKGHSLSVSDIVKTPDGLFFCDRYGWQKIEFTVLLD